MKTVSGRRLVVFLVVLGMVVGTGSVWWMMHHRPAARQSADVYYCPMHPTYTSDRPGDCPICNMRLVKREPQPAGARPAAAKEDICFMHNCPKVHEGSPCPMLVVANAGEEVTCPVCGTHITEQPASGAPTTQASAPEGYTRILLSPQKRQLIGIKTTLAVRRTLTKTVRTVGQIAYDPALYQAQQEYLQARSALATLATLARSPEADAEIRGQAERVVDAARMRLRLLGFSDPLIETLDQQEGPDETLLLTGSSGRAWLYAPIYEFELPLVRAGQIVAVEIPAIPGKRLEGEIRAIDPVLDPVTRSARVRAILADPDHLLKPAMFVDAMIQVAADNVLAIPAEAVFETGTRRIVFVDKGEGLLEPRDVTVGMRADGWYEVTSGVAEGEAVVTNGNFLIDSESRLKAALEGMSGSGGHQHGQ